MALRMRGALFCYSALQDITVRANANQVRLLECSSALAHDVGRDGKHSAPVNNLCG
ncbi:hypothetical protein L7F22_068703, partial [Adiantum nelumboides]|nr:hypothetical protein [Adiantum nelumboides]